MTTPHVFHLDQTAPTNKTEGGERIIADAKNFPILKGMSLYKLVLEKNGVREPHWHPNADELGYCIEGQVLVSFYNTYDLFERFLVKAGETFLIPTGAIHYIANVGEKRATLILQFSNENPEDFDLSITIEAFSNAVLGNTWGVNSDYFKALPRNNKDRFAVLTSTALSVPDEARYSNDYRYNLEGSEPLLQNSGGSARMARQNLWPILKRQALYSLILNGKGMREPHWHPETAEMGYVHKGHSRMTILNPQGKKDTYLLKPGDLYFIPEAYPHHIENLGTDDLHFLIFFNKPMPGDVGFTGSIKSFATEALSAILDVEPAFFNDLNKYYNDLFIVNKINPVDPIK